MGDSEGENNEYMKDENESLMNAYDSINKVTNYQKIECKDRDTVKSATYYENIFNDLDGNFNDIIAKYKDEYVNYKMFLAREDFFYEGSPDSTNYTVDENLPAWKTFEKDISNSYENSDDPSLQGVKKYKDLLNKVNEKKISEDEKMKNIIKNNYKQSYQYGYSWAYGGDNWSPGQSLDPRSTITNINTLELNLVGLQQQLSTTRVKLENDIHILQNCITNVSEEIDNYKLKNDKLTKKINSLKSASSTGEGRLYDSQLIYNQYYLGNWIIGLIIIYLIYKNIRYFMKNQEAINKNLSDIKDKTMSFSDRLGDKIKKSDNFNV